MGTVVVADMAVVVTWVAADIWAEVLVVATWVAVGLVADMLEVALAVAISAEVDSARPTWGVGSTAVVCIMAEPCPSITSTREATLAEVMSSSITPVTEFNRGSITQTE